jgi:hypothetical protein
MFFLNLQHPEMNETISHPSLVAVVSSFISPHFNFVLAMIDFITKCQNINLKDIKSIHKLKKQ